MAENAPVQLRRVNISELKGSVLGRIDALAGIVPLVERLGKEHELALDAVEKYQKELAEKVAECETQLATINALTEECERLKSESV